MLAELATGQARHEHMMQQHEEWKEQMDKYAAETRKNLAAASRHLRAHAKAILEIDAAQARNEATLDRSDRKLELHGDLIAELIKTKVDRKKRPPRK